MLGGCVCIYFCISRAEAASYALDIYMKRKTITARWKRVDFRWFGRRGSDGNGKPN